jgi:hypothetical protein
MSNEWNIDDEGCRVFENKRLNMNEETLEMIRRMRKKAEQVEKVERDMMGDS